MKKVVGVLFFLGGATILMGIITAEIFYNALYSISQNMISTLGASPPPHSVIREPSADIFDSAMVFSGIMIMTGAILLYKTHGKELAVLIGLMGFGAFGVGIFPAFHPVAHPLSALLTFIAGGLAAVVSGRMTIPPFSYLSFVLGTISLFLLLAGIFFAHLLVPILGAGGVERWVAYPIMIWLIGFGSYLMSTTTVKK